MRQVTEEGPRLAVVFSEDELDKLEEGLEDAGYRRTGDFEQTGERRFRHPGGSTARLFLEVGHLYVYPPGGTRAQSAPLAPFSPLRRECAAANERAGFGADGASSDDAEGGDEASSSSSDADHDGSTARSDGGAAPSASVPSDGGPRPSSDTGASDADDE